MSKPKSRHGKLADGKTRISLVSEVELKAELKKLAEKDRRGLSDFLRITLEDIVKKAKSTRGDGVGQGGAQL